MTNTRKLNDTDLCVMCGMCLPQCPTYQLYQNETESPRGRIALMQAIDQGHIEADAQALLHIDHCLGCLNCESICPSRVPYGKLIDEFRGQYHHAIKKPFTTKLILKQATKLNGIKKLASLANNPLIKPTINTTLFVGQLFGLDSSNPFTQPPVALKKLYTGSYSMPEQCRGEVSLFTGCSGDSLDQQTISDTIFILNQLKFDVYIESNQSCCGALHQHNGHPQTAETLLNMCISIFNQQSRPVLFFSPACGIRLQQLDEIKAIDARAFILKQLQQQPLTFSPPAQTVALHESCSHRNILKSKSLNFDLLNCIPQMRIIESSNPTLCCGAGGIQSSNYPQQANALLHGKLKSFDFAHTNVLISDNIGCSLHIKSAISAYNPDIEIIHPISFLTRNLKPNHQ